MEITILGFVIKQIHVQLAQLFAFVLMGIGLWGYLTEWYDNATGRAFDRVLVTKTTLAPTDDDRFVVQLRNIGSVEKLEERLRGKAIRAAMISSAASCTPESPFVQLRSPAEQEGMLHAVRNMLTRLSEAGEVAEAAGLPVTAEWILFSVTAADAGGNAVRMFRIQFQTERSLQRFLDLDPMQCDFEDGQESHVTRLNTLRMMAGAHFKNNGCLANGMRIVGRFVLKVPDAQRRLSV